MHDNRLRRSLLWSFLVFLALTALVAIAAVLSGEMGELKWRILATSGTISAASVCAMACAAFLERSRVRQLGLAGIVLAAAAAIVIVVGIWARIEMNGFWKVAATLSIWAAAVAHAELLWLPRLPANHGWVQGTATAAITVLACLLSCTIVLEVGDETIVRVTIVVAILVALQTLAIPILWKLCGGDAATTAVDRLLLTRLTDDVWTDATGNRFAVRRLEGDPPA